MANLVKFSHHLYLNCYYPLNFPRVLNCLEGEEESIYTYLTSIFSLANQPTITLKEQTETKVLFVPAELEKGEEKDSYLTANETRRVLINKF